METETYLVIEWKNVDSRERNIPLTHAIHSFGQEMARLYLMEGIISSIKDPQRDKVTFDLTVRVNLETLK